MDNENVNVEQPKRKRGRPKKVESVKPTTQDILEEHYEGEAV